ncbi:MAG TPA: PEP-CTERM sorting domain-containing protein [Bryobacteraceae bacterium]|jgi:hypothetical protein|nr:PEP-CTERM sorting domain-containing protein [Bryobacteraceae bacterium]
MKLRAKFDLSIGLLVFLCVMPGSLLRADNVYTYTGTDYTSCHGSDCFGTYALSLSFDTTLTGAQLDNLAINTVSGGDLTAYVSSFSFTDGTGLSFSEANPYPGGLTDIFDVSTDSNGNILSWNISAQLNGPGAVWIYAAETTDYNVITHDSGFANLDPTGQCGGCYNGGSQLDAPGTWEVTQVTPEPTTYFGLGAGLMGLLILAERSKRAQRPPNTD